jgi:hypothetical protein
MADGATYATMLNEIEYYKHYSDPSNYVPVYTDDDIQKYRDGSDPWGHPNTDWFDETLKPWSAVHKKYGALTIMEWTEFFLLHEAHHIFTIFQLMHDTEL